MAEQTFESLKPSTSTALIGGAIAGMCVDVVLFPIDTIKTRLQSDLGFWRSGGFRNIYSGLASTMSGSAPNAALFFCTYETSKKVLNGHVSAKYQPMVHMVSASFGEVMACLIRVPVEVVKQRAQTSNCTSLTVLRQTMLSEGFRGLYRGYFSTVVREVPFSFIQFPLWEFLKKYWSNHQNIAVKPWQATVCGAVSGGIAAFITTPLDVAKTKIMLAQKGSVTSSGNIFIVLKLVSKEKGIAGLYAGAVPRVIWISIGGAIFLGGYEKVVSTLQTI